MTCQVVMMMVQTHPELTICVLPPLGKQYGSLYEL
jgi:hypothetical protein